MRKSILTLATLAGAAIALPALAAVSLDQYPGTEEQIRNHFRDHFGQASANCGRGQINDISDATIVNDTPQQVTMQVSYSFSASSLQNTNTCSGSRDATVTFDKQADGNLTLDRMSGVNP